MKEYMKRTRVLRPTVKTRDDAKTPLRPTIEEVIISSEPVRSTPIDVGRIGDVIATPSTPVSALLTKPRHIVELKPRIIEDNSG